MKILNISAKQLQSLGIAFIVVIVGVAFDMHPPKSSADWAAWVQAVGSACAICGALWIAQYQVAAARDQASEQIAAARNLAIEKEDRDDRKKIDAIVAIVICVDSKVREISEILPDLSPAELKKSLRYTFFSLNAHCEALSNIPLHEVGSGGAIVGITELISALQKIHSVLNTLANLEDENSRIDCIVQVNSMVEIACFNAEIIRTNLE